MEALGNCPVCPPLNPALPGPITLIFSPRRAVVMTHTRAKIKFKMSDGSKVRSGNSRTDRRTDTTVFITFLANTVGNNDECCSHSIL